MPPDPSPPSRAWLRHSGTPPPSWLNLLIRPCGHRNKANNIARTYVSRVLGYTNRPPRPNSCNFNTWTVSYMVAQPLFSYEQGNLLDMRKQQVLQLCSLVFGLWPKITEYNSIISNCTATRYYLPLDIRLCGITTCFCSRKMPSLK